MTEIRDEPQLIPKQTDTKRIIEHIENCRTGLLREVLSSRAELGSMIVRCVSNKLDSLIRLCSYIVAFLVTITITLCYLGYQLYKITEKLTALGL